MEAWKKFTAGVGFGGVVVGLLIAYVAFGAITGNWKLQKQTV